MFSTRKSRPECPISLRTIIRAATQLLLATSLIGIALCLSPALAHAQYGSLPVGQVTGVTAEGCPGSGWYPGMHCYSASITGCTTTTQMDFNFGYLSPTSGTIQGVIVFFNGRDGTLPDGAATGTPAGEWEFITDYLGAGYEVVQLAWSFPWQQYYNPWPGGGTPAALSNVQAGACRPATFMNYVFNSIYLPITQGASGNPRAGMCAQGASAGSAQVAYSLAYYAPPSNTQWWLDNVELISGPVLSDIAQGCVEPPPQNPTTICPSGQAGCRLGTGGSSWSLYPTYLSGPNQSVGMWTNNASCAIPGTNTTQTSYNLWLKQSIVDQPLVSGGVVPVFSYPHTAMGGWLCRSVHNPNNINCTTNFKAQYCPNNSSPQGQLFHAQVSLSPPPTYNVYAVDNCNSPEGVADPISTVLALNNLDGYDAVKQDMESSCRHTTQ